MKRSPYRPFGRWNWAKVAEVIGQDRYRLHYLDPGPEVLDASLWAWREVWKAADGRVSVNAHQFPQLSIREWQHTLRIFRDFAPAPLPAQVWAIAQPYQLVP